MDQARVAINDRHWTAEAPHRLGKLEADIAASKYNQVFRNATEIQCLDGSHRLRFDETRRRIDRRVGSGINNNFLSAEDSPGALRGCDLNSFCADKAPETHNQFRPALFI